MGNLLWLVNLGLNKSLLRIGFNQQSFIKPLSLGELVDYSHEIKMTTSQHTHMGVSENGGTPKSSNVIGISIINHPFWGTPIFGNTHMKHKHPFHWLSVPDWNIGAWWQPGRASDKNPVISV